MQSESPISAAPVACLIPPCFLYAHSSMLPSLPPAAGEQLTGKSFLIMLVMLNYWDFWRILVVRTSAEVQHSATSILIRMLKRLRTHTHTRTFRRRLLQNILSFSKWGLGQGQGAAGMSVVAAGRQPRPLGKSGGSLCPSEVKCETESVDPQTEVPQVAVRLKKITN